MADLSTLKKRLGGFQKAFNGKAKHSLSLIQLVRGPPILKTPTVVSQLKDRLDEVTQANTNLTGTIEAILAIVEKEKDDKTAYDHYVDYMTKINHQFEDVRIQITEALALIETPLKTEDSKESTELEIEDEDGGKFKNSQPKSCVDLKPFVLNRRHTPETFAVWKRALEAWYVASNFEKLPLKSSQEYIRKVVEKELMALVEPSVGDDTPIFSDENSPEVDSIVSLLSGEISDRNPKVSQRFRFFQQKMGSSQTFSEFISQLRSMGNFCDLAGLDPNGLIIFYALTNLKNEGYQDLKDELLRLPPEQLTMDRVVRLTKAYESARFALSNIKRMI